MAGERVVIGRFGDADHAQQAVERLIERDYPMDRVSLLGHAGAPGDDPLGIYYRTRGERMLGWGKLGAFWGGLWGLLTGAAGMFLVPGLGPILAAGPVVEALVGAAGGAAVGGGAMAGAGVLGHLAAALHASGVPESELDRLHAAIERGEYVLLLQCPQEECAGLRAPLEASSAEEVLDFPYHGLLPE